MSHPRGARAKHTRIGEQNDRWSVEMRIDLPVLAVLFRELFCFFDHALDILVRQPSLLGRDGDLLNLARRLVFR